MKKFSQAALGAMTAVAVGFSATVPAQAQSSAPENFVADVLTQVETGVQDVRAQVENTAWDTRTQVQQAVNASFDDHVSAQLLVAFDNLFDLLFPGMISRHAAEALRIQQEYEAEQRAIREREAAAERARQEEERARQAQNTPCPADADVCVDVDGRRSWLQDNGRVTYGPVQVGPGKPGYETPRGTFYVNRKVKDEVSYIFNMAPMPYAVYFTYNGIAFHAGDPNILSHGCVRMWYKDAQAFYADLQIGDKVFVY